MMLGPWLDKLVAIGTRMAVALENIAKEATTIRQLLELRAREEYPRAYEVRFPGFRCQVDGCIEKEPHEHVGRMLRPIVAEKG